MDGSGLKRVLDDVLQRYDFQRRGTTWYRTLGEIRQLIDVQKSQYSNLYYINIAVYPVGMPVEGLPFPRGHKCPMRVRIEGLMPDAVGDIQVLFDLENESVADAERVLRIGRIVESRLIPVLETLKDEAVLRDYIGSSDSRRWLVNLSLKKRLGLA